MSKNVLLIALGGIGFRHFQAILNCEEGFDLYVVDINKDALNHAKEYADSLDKKFNINYLTDVEDVPEIIDVAIIATPSIPRRSVLEKLLANHKVDSIIFEKFLFPKLEDYEAVNKILNEKRINAYVDCTARMYDVYHRIKEESKGCKYFNAIMKGSNWGMACNAIHLVDQVAFMAGADTKNIYCSGIFENEIVESKRKGYIEFYGKIVGNIGNNCTFIIECDHKENDLSFEFVTDKASYFVDEGKGIFTKVNYNKSDSAEMSKTIIPYVSQLTNKNVDRLIRKESIDLPTYDESRPLHEELLKCFLLHMNKVNCVNSDLCPIT